VLTHDQNDTAATWKLSNLIALSRHPLSVLRCHVYAKTWTFLLSSNGTERGHPALQPHVDEGVPHSESDILFGIDLRGRSEDEWSPLLLGLIPISTML